MRTLLIGLAALAWAPDAVAQLGDYPLKITEVGVGLPPGRFGDGRDATTSRLSPILKRARWAPVQLKIEVQGESTAGVALLVESIDGDGLKTAHTVPLLPSLAGQKPGTILTPADYAAVPYVRHGDNDGTVTLSLVTTDGRGRLLADRYRTPYLQTSDASHFVVFSLGSRLPGFTLPAEESTDASARSGLRRGRVETAAAATVMDLPDQWIGYDAVDVAVLPTGANATQFLTELFGPNVNGVQLARREALLEWIRRGGSLVVSVGTNASVASQLPALQAILPRPVALDPPVKPVAEVAFNVIAGGTRISERLKNRGDDAPPVPLANLMPARSGRPARTLIPSADEPDPGPEVVVQSAYGLGTVTLVTFDLDTSPFLDFSARPQVWDFLLRQSGHPRAALAPPGNASPTYQADTENGWLTAIRGDIDTFEGVPVVSFGWVALFIALYTLLIGPVEYLVLKHVFGRLELTWVTFPVIVVTVSAVAYFTAYAIKGNDLKVNKIDVVDFDLGSGRVTGCSFFTIFSPRIDSYTVGVTPRDGVAKAAGDTPPPTVGWLAGGSGAGGGIISRGYGYASDPGTGATAAGLTKVPIQVWSTKALQASWVGSVDPASPPVQAELFHPPGDPTELAGSLTSNLPFGTVEQPVLIYAGIAYELPTLAPGQRIDIPAGGLKRLPNYFSDAATVYLTTPVAQQYGTAPSPTLPATRGNRLTGILFHELATPVSSPLNNASLRELDLSGRVGRPGAGANRDEAILVGYLPPQTGSAEALQADAAGPSATTLWLRELPSSGQPRTPTPGFLRQETAFRVMIPIPPVAASPLRERSNRP